MPEEQTFCVLKKIMFEYGLRELFRDGFEVLHMRFYQLGKLIEVSPQNVPREESKSTKYDSTLITYFQGSYPLKLTLLTLMLSFLTGAYPWIVAALPGAGCGSAHVCQSVVPHPLHCQVPTLHGVPLPRPLPPHWSWFSFSGGIGSSTGQWPVLRVFLLTLLLCCSDLCPRSAHEWYR